MDQFGYSAERGLFLPGSTTGAHQPKYKAGPNPMNPPAVEPSVVDDLRRIAQRTGRQLRFYWMKETRIWAVQVLQPNGQWECVVHNYDEDGAWERNPYPYRPCDKRFLDEICEADLKIKYGTGDTGKDHEMARANMAAKEAASKAKKFDDGAEMIERMVTGDDPRRFFRLLGHEEAHGGGGVKFTEFFQVARNTPLPDKPTPETE